MNSKIIVLCCKLNIIARNITALFLEYCACVVLVVDDHVPLDMRIN